MVDNVFPYISFLKKLVLKNHWNSLHRVTKINIPILFIISLQDELVPSDHMMRLKKAATNS